MRSRVRAVHTLLGVAVPVLLGGALVVAVPVSRATAAPNASAGPDKAASPTAQARTAARFDTGASAGNPSTRAQRPAGGTRAVLGTGEIPAMRTPTSDTYLTGSGYRTVLATGPVNYRTATGTFVPIDTGLTTRPDGSYANKADSMSATLPANADGPVRAAKAAAVVITRLVGAAHVPAEVAGSSATYRGAYPGVDVRLDIRPETVKETLLLANAGVPASFASTVTLTQGFSLRLDGDRTVSVLDAGGRVAAHLPAPWMQDSSGNVNSDTSTDVRYSISGTRPNYTVTVLPSHAWLSDPARVFPVRLDPTVTFSAGTSTGCYYAETGATDPTTCSYSTGSDNYLSYGDSGYARRTYVSFPDVNGPGSAIPPDAVVTNANLTFTELYQNNTTANLATQLYLPNGTWGATTTWSTMPAPSGNQVDAVTLTPPGVGNTVTFNPVSAVRGWVDGSSSNRGLMVRVKDEGTMSNTIRFYGFANAAHRPTLTVTWSPQVGQLPAVGAYDHRLSDRMDLHVDLATRNLVLNGTDEAVRGPGQSLVVRRTYNSLPAANGQNGAYGPGWTMNGGVDNGLSISRTQVTVTQAGGALGYFTRHFEQSSLTVGKNDSAASQDSNPADGTTDGPSYLDGPGLRADLRMSDSTHYTLTNRKTHVKQTFTMPSAGASTAWLSKVEDSQGNAVSYTATGSPLVTTKVSDPTGQRSVTLGYTSGLATSMSETLAAGATGARSWSYGYTGGLLTSYTDPAGKLTRYCYTGNLLTKIVTPRGVSFGGTCTTTQGVDVTDIAYDANHQVSSVSYENGTAPTITVAFATSEPLPPGDTSGATTETDPYGKATIFTFDTRDRITKTTSPLGYTASKTFNTNDDVTASVDATNFTGAAGDPSTTSTYSGDNLTKVTAPTGASASATYANTGANSDQPDTASDDSGNTTNYSYNSAGQISSAARGGASVTVRRQGDSGIANCGPGSPATAAYQGAVCEDRDALYSSSTPAEHRVLFRYDALGEMTSQTPAQPDHSRTTPPALSYTYDGQSRLQAVTDSRGAITSYSYDTLDRLVRVTRDDGGYTQYAYDDDGNKTSGTTYTLNGRVATAVSSTSYTYDNLNRLATQTQDSNGTITQTWDANSRLATFDDGTGAGQTSYGYNSDGTLTSMTDPGGSCGGYSLTMLPPAGSGCILFGVDKAGRRQRTVFPGDVAEQNQTFDTDGKIATILGTGQNSGGPVTFFNLSYDYTAGSSKTGHVQTRSDAQANNRVQYGYDSNARLTTAKQYDNASSGGTNTASWLYCYDAGGNRTYSSTTVGATCPSSGLTSYDGASQQLGTNQSYDLDGDETSTVTSLTGSGTVRASGWSDTQQFTSSTLNGGGVLANTYAGADNSLLLTAATASTSTDSLVYGPLGLQSVTNAPNGYPTGTTFATERDPAGTLVALRINGVEKYLLSDNLGSILRVLATTGLVADAYHYDPFGTQTIDVNNRAQPFGYTGAYANSGTGLVHLAARHYDPTQGRFTQPDPVAHPTDTSQSTPYPYAGDDPVNHADPGGLWSLSLSGSVCAFGGCLSASVGVDDDGDVNVGGSVGVGGGGGVSASYDPSGNYTSGQGGVTATAGCNVGPVSTRYDFVSGKPSTTLTTSTGVGCSADVGGNYTF